MLPFGRGKGGDHIPLPVALSYFAGLYELAGNQNWVYLCSFSLAGRPLMVKTGGLVSNSVNIFYVTEQDNVAMLTLANSVEQKGQISGVNQVILRT